MLIGARGYDHAAWSGPFYPEDLPEDWRFCFYSNRQRALLIPAEQAARATDAEIAQWSDDSDEGFRFVMEVPPAVLTGVQPVADWLQRLRVLMPRIAGFLVVADADTREAVLQSLAGVKPLCVDLPASLNNEAWHSLMQSLNAGRCWRVAQAPVPVAGGSLIVALSPGGDPRALRAQFEALAAVRGASTQLALFVDEPAAAARQLHDIRVLAELMGL
jgi:hypothetical protein